MTDHQRSTTVDAEAFKVFGYLSQVENLTSYFSGMTSATPGPGDDEVQVEADIDGTRREAKAHFHVSSDSQRIEWSSEGPDDYRGWLEVAGSGSSSVVTVHLSTAREGAAGPEIDEGIDRTLATIKQILEDG